MSGDEYPLAWPWLAEMMKRSSALQGGIELKAGEYRDVTPESWKSESPPKPVKGTITVEGGTATVNIRSSDQQEGEC